MVKEFLVHKRLISLSFMNYVANVLLYILIVLSFLRIINDKWFIGFSAVIGLFYYISLAFFLSHYILIFQPILKKNKDLFIAIIWISAFVLGYFIFYRFVDKDLAHTLFGSVIALFLGNFCLDSFKKWWKNRKKKPKRKK